MDTSTMMLFFIIILLSSKRSHILCVNGEGYILRRDEYNGVLPKGFVFEKISAFWGFKGYNSEPSSKNWNRVYGSLSPSPSPAPALAPVAHSHQHHNHPFPKRVVPRTPLKDANKGVLKRVLIAVFVSVGAAFVIFGLGLIWVCKKLGKKKKGAEIRGLARRNRGETAKSVRKMRSDPCSGRFYLESIETAFRPHTLCNMPSSEAGSGRKVIEIGEWGEETEKSHSRNVKVCLGNVSFHDNAEQTISEKGNSSIKIVSSHEDAEQTISEKGNSSIKIVSSHEDAEQSYQKNAIVDDRFVDECSSDNESFHSFPDSQSSNIRLSNASSENLSPRSLNFSNISVTSPENRIPDPSPSTNTDSRIGFRRPPPPPPLPPLPPRSEVSLHHSSSRVTPVKFRTTSSSSLPFSFSPTNSYSSAESNQTSGQELPPNHLAGIPPPPCPPTQLVKLGKGGAPLAKLKPLHWDKVRAAPDRSMVWDNLRTNSFEFDEEMMESLFRYNLQSCSKGEESKSKSPSPTKHLIEPMRLQNINILSKALNVTAEQVCEALIEGQGLCLQQLEALAKMVLTNEEEAKLLNYKGGIKELSSAERFVKTILNIPLAFPRIEAMLYRETFEDEIVHLRRSFSMLEEACKELRSSRLFLKLLEAVLKTGNRMNVGTMRGGARAFKLDALLKLADVKGTDGKTTLIHFVVQEIVRSEGLRIPESIMGKINLKTRGNNNADKEEICRKMGLDLISGLSTELCNVKKTATIGLDVLASSISNLSDGMIKLNLLLGNELVRNEKNGRFLDSMESFVCHADKNLKELLEYEGRVLLRVKEITEYFHGSLSKDEPNPLRIFMIVRDFLGMLDNVCKELRSSKLPSSPNPLSPFR